MTRHLRRLGYRFNRKHIERLMRLMGPEHKIYPYLLRDLVIDYPDQVWAADITYIPMARGFMFLVAVICGVSTTVPHYGVGWRSGSGSTTRNAPTKHLIF